jgi:hypothetical protein
MHPQFQRQIKKYIFWVYLHFSDEWIPDETFDVLSAFTLFFSMPSLYSVHLN